MKKRVVVFTSSGGGGHESATKALTAYLKNDYEVIPSYIFVDALKPLDPMRYITFGRMSGEQVYNFCVRKKKFRLLNLIYRFGGWHYGLLRNYVRTLLHHYLQGVRPDIIISVIPLVSNDIMYVAKQMGIPFLLTPTDLDATTFVHGIYKPDYRKFHCALSFDDIMIRKTIASAHIPQDQISIAGFPLRPEFFALKNKQDIKKNYNIPQDRRVVLILMGASGSGATHQFVQELTKIDIPLHVVVVLGRNKQLRPKIESLIEGKKLTATIFDFTNHIADLMAMADVCISKSGSVSVVEAIYSNLPLILDATGPIINWERLNHTFVREHGFGTSVEQVGDTASLVKQFLSNDGSTQYRCNLECFEKKRADNEIRQIVNDLLDQ